MRRLYFDSETFSEVDLTASGAHRYTEDPSFLVLMVAWAVDDGPVTVSFDPAEVPYLYDPSVVKVAQNITFDRLALKAALGREIPLDQCDDPAPRAAEAGLPTKLGLLAKAVGAPDKDTAGTRLINLFSKPNRKGDRTLPEDRLDKWEEFVAYCVQDVETLREVDRRVPDWPTRTERLLWELDQRINDRGIRADARLARNAVDAAADNRRRHIAEVREITGVDNPNSVAQLSAWLGMDNLQAKTVAAELERDDLSDPVRRVLELRQSLALSSSKKFDAVLARMQPDGRVRGQFRFFGAHTGRWTGTGVQLQNLSRATVPFLGSDERRMGRPENFEREAQARASSAAIADLALGLGADDQTLRALVRSVLLGPFTVVDFSAIEARVLGWLAGERWVMDAFRAGEDIYVATAERMGGLTRQEGKAATLGLGFCGTVAALRRVGGRGSDEELQELVARWRGTNPAIVRFWARLGEAYLNGGRVGRIRVEREHDVRRVFLPSGRSLTYRNVQVVRGQYGKLELLWDTGRGKTRLWHGLATENVTQAVARDILADSLLALDSKGYWLVGHVHDEVIIEGEHDPAEVARVMCSASHWAEGLPLAAEGFTCARYTKG